MKTRILLNGNDGSYRIGIGELFKWEALETVDWKGLDSFIKKHQNRTKFVTFSYALHAEILGSNSNNEAPNFPLISIWIPENTYFFEGNTIVNSEGEASIENEQMAIAMTNPRSVVVPQLNWQSRQSKEEYIETVQLIQQEIQLGNVYEVNYCQEFFAENVIIQDGFSLYFPLNEITKAPFSAYLENENWVVACGSPERFIQKKGDKLISQPIKGTIARGENLAEDNRNKETLLNSKKDQTENTMIVDLVRNDLARLAQKGSVQVDELSGIYSFPTVHQLISTISCRVKEGKSFSEIIRATFPMGSMTGAPKLAAVNLASHYEQFNREIYSGSIGYISPTGDFDCNVVIRSLVYDKQNHYLSCGVGGAIIQASIAEEEYEECRTKVGKILSIFGECQW